MEVSRVSGGGRRDNVDNADSRNNADDGDNADKKGFAKLKFFILKISKRFSRAPLPNPKFSIGSYVTVHFDMIFT